ncbi:UDP-N-acetylmuramate--L-alanine ligase [Halocola ammonii]
MKLKEVDIFYFLGIGGIGMSALARYFHLRGARVAGYDRTESPLVSELISEGIEVNFEDSTSAIPEWVTNADMGKTMIVYTPAIPQKNIQLNYLRDNGFELKKRSTVLGLITEKNYTIAVGGTHGKTTVTSMLAHIFHSSGHGCGAFLGGIAANYNSNLIYSENPTKIIVEADEYDRSFLTLSPNVAVITSMDADHLDIYGEEKSMVDSFFDFAKKIVSGGKLFLKKALPQPELKNVSIDNYSIIQDADYSAKNIRVTNGNYRFDLSGPSIEWTNLEVGLPGRHNVENAVAAIAVAHYEGIDEEKIKEAIATFKGARRRFEYQIKTDNLVFIDDYAHHPRELEACIGSVREMHPEKRITGVFQPHLFSRTRDFADGFARALEKLDEIILLDIYPAREEPIEGVDSQWLMDKIQNTPKKCVQKIELLDELKQRAPEVLLTLGAGDIDRLVLPIKNMLLEENDKVAG